MQKITIKHNTLKEKRQTIYTTTKTFWMEHN
jgi:hypothetical protein